MKKIITLILLLTLATGAKARIIDVTPSEISALYSAIESAGGNDTVMLAAGTYNLTSSITIPGYKTLTLIGAGAEKTIIDGGWNGDRESNTGVQLFIVYREASLTIEGVTLQHGNAGGSGGGAIENLGTAVLKNCRLIDNLASSGGAIYSADADLTVINCELTGNISQSEGGAFRIIGETATLLLMNTTITGNHTAGNGGGILLFGCTATILNSIIAGNTSGVYERKDIFLYIATINMAYSAYEKFYDHAKTGTLSLIENLAGVTAANILNTNSDYPTAIGDAKTKGTATAYDGTNAYYHDGTGWKTAAGVTGSPSTNNYLTPIGHTLMGAPRPKSTIVSTVDDIVDPNDGATSLREAIAYAITTGYSVTFDAALNGAAIKVNKNSGTFELDENQTLTILGNGSDNTIIDGGWDEESSNTGVQLFKVNAATASLTIKDVTLQHGNAGTNGGGAIENKGSIFLTDCQLTDNRASSGGAISSSGDLTAINCVLTENVSSSEGGAIAIMGNSPVGRVLRLAADSRTALLINTTITGNHAESGGGLAIGESATATILNSIIAGNTVGDDDETNDIANATTSATVNMLYCAYGTLEGNNPVVNTANQSGISVSNVLNNNSDFPNAIGNAKIKGTATAYDGTDAYYHDGTNWKTIAGVIGTPPVENHITPIGHTIMGALRTLKASEPTEHYDLTFIIDEGIRINPIALNYAIAESNDYTFYMYMKEGFEEKKPYVTINDQPVAIRETQDGTGWVYRIPAIYEDKTIVVVLQDLVDNLNPEAAGIHIYSAAGSLVIETQQPTAITVYTVSGQAIAQQQVEDRAIISLPKGIYIIQTDKGAIKAVVR